MCLKIEFDRLMILQFGLKQYLVFQYRNKNLNWFDNQWMFLKDFLVQLLIQEDELIQIQLLYMNQLVE